VIKSKRVLVVRLGAMGDIVHTLPAVASLKHSMPHSEITWVVESKWRALLENNPYVDRLIPFDRGALHGLRSAWRELRRERFDLAIDFQGLIKSGLVAACARPERLYGFDSRCARESAAALFYSTRVHSDSVHRVDKYLDLAAAAGVTNPLKVFPLPEGSPEGRLPGAEYVLASPFAGWGSKQWPIEYYAALGERLRRDCGLPLVLNGPEPVRVAGSEWHVSGLPGLIHATRRASAIVGVDSGPLHIAAAIGKPGIAIYGPTDPAATGPYGKTFKILRSPAALTTYKRGAEPDASMRAISPDQVFEQLKTILEQQKTGVASHVD
jgi:heptosyltransferase-1